MTDKKGCAEVGQDTSGGCKGVLVKSTGELERVQCEGNSGKET